MPVDDNISCPPCVVLVTGGSGFLGQHVVKLLQQKALHVTEIRVLDMDPFVQKLDYTERVNVKRFNGSITDLDLVRKACNDVDCVIHLVALIDVSIFPNTERLHEINVKGSSLKTLTIRPTHIYGEGDQIGIATSFRLTAYSDSYRRVHISCCKHQSVYVGNVAWMFVCAEIRMRKLSSDADRTIQAVEGNIFIACDDSPILKEGDFHGIFLDEFGLRRKKPDVPVWLVKLGLYFLMFILSFVRLIKEVNIFIGPEILKMLEYTWWFNYNKATYVFGYKPLYAWPESKKRSLNYYATFMKKR